MENVKIKVLESSDLDEFCRVRLNSLEEYPVAFSMMPELFKSAPVEAKRAQLDDSASDSPNFILGIFLEDKLLGIIGFLVNQRGSVAHKGTMWGFYIDPKYQSKGLGRALLKAYIEKINSIESIKFHRLMTPVNGKNAISLFESVGFIKYGQEPNAISDGKDYFDQYYYYMNSE